MRTLCMLVLCTFGLVAQLAAQELNAVVVVNHAQAERASPDVMQALQRDVSAYLNTTTWSQTTFAPHERVQCTFTFVVKQTDGTNQYDVELLVGASRPVYNSMYQSPLLVWREASFRFEYDAYQPLVFTPNNPTHQLSATLAYYAYMILGLDGDSMAERGGTAFFEQAHRIATAMQTSGATGWESMGDNRSRLSLVQSLVDGSADDFRRLWYAYHREALDTMADDKTQALEIITTQLNSLETYRQHYPRSILTTMFGDTKLSEVVGLFESSPAKVRHPLYTTLRNLYPTKASQFDSLNRP